MDSNKELRFAVAGTFADVVARWEIDGEVVHKNICEEHYNDVSLSIYKANTSRPYSGVVTCTFTDAKGQVISSNSMDLSVIYIPELRIVRDVVTKYELKVGETAKLDLDVTGAISPVTCVWFYNGTKIQDSKYAISSSLFNEKNDFKPTKVGSGTVHCEITDGRGRKVRSKDISIIVTEKA